MSIRTAMRLISTPNAFSAGSYRRILPEIAEYLGVFLEKSAFSRFLWDGRVSTVLRASSKRARVTKLSGVADSPAAGWVLCDVLAEQIDIVVKMPPHAPLREVIDLLD